MSTAALGRVARLIRAHRDAVGARRRALDPGRQALLTLAYVRKGETLRDLAAGFGISAATAWRCTRETIQLLAARVPGIHDALQYAKRIGAAFVILDGPLVRIDRNRIDRPFYSGKHKQHGMNLRAAPMRTAWGEQRRIRGQWRSQLSALIRGLLPGAPVGDDSPRLILRR